jgi:hypothetical protein
VDSHARAGNVTHSPREHAIVVRPVEERVVVPHGGKRGGWIALLDRLEDG